MKTVLVWIETVIIVLLGIYIIFSEPKEKIVVKYETKYKTIVEEKIVEKECKPKVKIVYKKTEKIAPKDNFLLASDSDMNNYFTISLISNVPIKDTKTQGESILLNGTLEELGYKSKFMLSANKKLIKNSYFKIINKKTKNIYTSPLCFERLGNEGLYDVKLNIIGGGVYCDVEETREDEILDFGQKIEERQVDEGELMANDFIEDVSQIFKELNATMPDINKTKLKRILLKSIKTNEELLMMEERVER